MWIVSEKSAKQQSAALKKWSVALWHDKYSKVIQQFDSTAEWL